MGALRIIKTCDGCVTEYAAQELAKYIEMMTGGKELYISISDEDASTAADGLYLGITKNLSPENDFELEDEDLDDAVFINVERGRGVITGSNPRSILLAVYRFLYEVGCRWVRPGKEGEVIPEKRLSEMTARIREAASLRHRGIVIEGANSYENVRDMIEWLPKVGFNSYFMQFKEAYTFFENWYKHVNNALKEPEEFSIENARDITRRLENEIKKRGLIYHAVGHGWTCEPLGIPALGWNADEYVLSPEKSQYLAEINGKREFWGGVPINTNLCYSNPEVRELMANHIIEYIESHRHIDFLHVWLADDYNNHCECENCINHKPADLYIKLLNLIDDKMTDRNLDTKIVFLLYFDLLWAPERERIVNPDRFVMMFAPISRTFERSYNELEGDVDVLPYVRNKIVVPGSVAENIAYLKSWQKVFAGDSFDFDYPLGRAHYGDPGYYNISRVISNDIKSLNSIGLNGYLSCQEQRAFMPTGLPNYVMGMTLWNSSLEFEKVVEDYFSSAFGPAWKECKDYLSSLSDLFSVDYWNGMKKWIDPDMKAAMEKVSSIVDNFMNIIAENLRLENPCQRKSWEYLNWHGRYTKLFARALHGKAVGDESEADSAWQELKSYLQETEDRIQPVFDVYRFIQLSKWKLQVKN